MKSVLTLVLGVAASLLVAAIANAGEFSPVPSAKSGHSLASWRVAGCRQVCDRKIGDRCVSYRTVCSGNSGAVRG